MLKARQQGEADLILTLFSREYGKLVVRAPGVRRVTSRKRGHLQTFSQVRVFLARGKTWDVITEAQSVDNHTLWREDLAKVTAAYTFCELVDKLVPEKQENREVYELLVTALSGLGKAQQARLDAWQRRFSLRLLEMLGFWPVGEKVDEETLGLYVKEILERPLKSGQLLG